MSIIAHTLIFFGLTIQFVGTSVFDRRDSRYEEWFNHAISTSKIVVLAVSTSVHLNLLKSTVVLSALKAALAMLTRDDFYNVLWVGGTVAPISCWTNGLVHATDENKKIAERHFEAAVFGSYSSEGGLVASALLLSEMMSKVGNYSNQMYQADIILMFSGKDVTMITPEDVTFAKTSLTKNIHIHPFVIGNSENLLPKATWKGLPCSILIAIITLTLTLTRSEDLACATMGTVGNLTFGEGEIPPPYVMADRMGTLRRYFASGVPLQRVQVSLPKARGSNSPLYISSNILLQNPDGTIFAVLGEDINIERFAQVLDAYSIPPDSYSFLMYVSGTLTRGLTLVHPKYKQ